MPATGLYSVGRLSQNLISGSRLNYHQVAFKSHLGCRRISARLIYLGSSIVLAVGLYSREQSSTQLCLDRRLISTTVIDIAGVSARCLVGLGSSIVLMAGRIPRSKALLIYSCYYKQGSRSQLQCYRQSSNSQIGISCRQSSKGLFIQLQAKQQVLVSYGIQQGISLAVGEAVKVKCSTTGRAVEVNYGTIVRQQGISLAAKGTLQQRLGSSIV